MAAKRRKNLSSKSNSDFHGLGEVIGKIDEALARRLSLSELAFLSAASYSEFHRRFRRAAGETIGKHILRLVLEKSAYELKISPKPVSEIAFEAGFLSHEAFTRAFRRQFAMSPRQFRSQWSHEQPSRAAGKDLAAFRFSIVPDFDIAYLRCLGSYAELPGPISSAPLVRELNQFAETYGLTAARWVGISNDDPSITPAEKLRFDLGVVLPPGAANLPIPTRRIIGGKYAVWRHSGSYEALPAVYERLFANILKEKRVVLRNAAPFESYIRRADDDTAITDIYLPLAR